MPYSEASIDAAESLFELAKLRLNEGDGDAEQGGMLLECLVNSFAGTRAADEAAKLLRERKSRH
jgi:hypothetical protein